MLGSRIPDMVVMRYAVGELPRVQRILLRGALLLSPRLRKRVRQWRRFSDTMMELSAGARESVLWAGPHLVTELDEGPARSGLVDSEGVERGERMTSFAPDGWGPGLHRLWGPIIVALGFGFVAFGRSQDKLLEQMGVRGQADTPVFSEFECFGVGLAVSGMAYGLTGEFWLFITCIFITSIVFEFGPQSRSD